MGPGPCKVYVCTHTYVYVYIGVYMYIYIYWYMADFFKGFGVRSLKMPIFWRDLRSDPWGQILGGIWGQIKDPPPLPAPPPLPFPPLYAYCKTQQNVVNCPTNLSPGSWMQDILDRGSWMQDPGSWMLDAGCRIQDPGSRIPDVNRR